MVFILCNKIKGEWLGKNVLRPSQVTISETFTYKFCFHLSTFDNHLIVKSE